MIVKFIVTKNRRIIFGNLSAKDEFHSDIAKKHEIKPEEIMGGGLADLDAKKISGTSTAFGRYDPQTVKRLLPDWDIEKLM